MPTNKQVETPVNIEFYKKLVATVPGIELKGASMPYTSLNGNMFSFLDKFGSCGIRLPEIEREAFLKKYKTTLFHTQGTVLKEYVTVPDALLKDTKELNFFFSMSYKYAKTLKAKPAKKTSKK
ncbi:MAG: hypothetical protein ACKVPJ_06775 [Chitinophagales bacterium]